VLVDGLAGAGKTTLAGLLADRLRRGGAPGFAGSTVAVVAADDLYQGWAGLPGVGRRAYQQLVHPLVDGTRPRLASWDWHAARWGSPEPLPAADVVLLEGVGSWSAQLAPFTTLLVWVESPPERRRSRALARDGEVFAPHWDAWAADERRLLAREATRAHADVVWPTDGW
jgi:uridine kinase